MPYPSATDLASFLKQDVDTSTATLALAKTIGLFEARARSHWGATPANGFYDKPISGQGEIILPYAPVVAVSLVQILRFGGSVQTLTLGTDYSRIEQSLYRRTGWGYPYMWPPDEIQVTYTYGYSDTTEDVNGVILESAGAMYMNPDVTTASETIDDYSVRSAPNTGGAALSTAAAALADWYAGVLVG
jgi:hypothetical protein